MDADTVRKVIAKQVHINVATEPGDIHCIINNMIYGGPNTLIFREANKDCPTRLYFWFVKEGINKGIINCYGCEYSDYSCCTYRRLRLGHCCIRLFDGLV